MKNLNKNRAFNDNMNHREEILSLISREIQNKIGLTYPKIVDKTRFENDKRELEESIRNVNHFSQNDWPECFSIFDKIVKKVPENMTSHDEIDKNNLTKCLPSLCKSRYVDNLYLLSFITKSFHNFFSLGVLIKHQKSWNLFKMLLKLKF